MKITAYSLMVLLLLVVGMASCGKKNGGLSGANDTVVDSTQKEVLYVWVENARVRKEPEIDAELITELKGGTRVVLTGETSTSKIKVNLRGVDFEDVWVKVKTDDDIEGWIFKGMLTSNEDKAKAMNDFLIVPGEGVGQVKVGTSKKELALIFGSEFITDGIVYDVEGVEWPGFYIFKGSLLELQCVINENDSSVVNIKIRQPGSNWATAEGIKVGTTMDAMVKLNGKSISFDGFGTDYGGWIEGYNKGNLSTYDGSIGICFGEPDDLTGLDDFMGDQVCSTSNKAILGKGVKVAEMVVYAPRSI